MSRLGKFNKANLGFSKASLQSSGMIDGYEPSSRSRMSKNSAMFKSGKLRKQKTKYVKDPELESHPFNDKSFDKYLIKIHDRV